MRKRGTILLTVLLVIVIASVVGAGSIYTARAEALSAGVTLRRTQARALAWSGVQAVMSELAEQREALLDGEEPRLSEEWELFEDGGVRAVVRLSAWPDGGALVRSESARLNLNSATEDMLVGAGFDQKEAAAIIAARGERGFSSVQDLLQVEGVSLSKLRGTGGGIGGEDEAPADAILDRLTVWSFDANIQTGLGNDGARHRGKLRVNLAGEWNDRLSAAIDDRFGEGASNAVKSLREKGTTFKSMADVVSALNTLSIQPKDWPGVLDAFTTTDDPYIGGRIDLSRAPAEVLASIPGIGAGAAEQIVQERESLDAEVRRSVAWPAVQGIVPAAEMVKAVDHLTTRSLQWRMRIEVGLAGENEGTMSARDVQLRDRLVWEVVVDVASERPRVAYLRDVTMEAAAGALYESLVAGGSEDAGLAGGEEDIEALIPRDDRPAQTQPQTSSLSFFETPAEVPGLELPGLRPRANLNFGSGLRSSQRQSTAGRRESSSAGADMGDLEWMGLDPAGDDGLLRMGPWELEDVEEAPSNSGVDRRLGRWTSGKKGGAR